MVEATTPPNPAGSGNPNAGSYRAPIPDPTLLTIDSIRREITMLENLFDTRLDAAESLVKARLERIDHLLQRSEEQRVEQKKDTKDAVDAALESQKEATAKMERSISDQISSLRSNFETEIRTLQTGRNENREAITKLESTQQGGREQRTESRAITSGQVALFGVVLAGFVLIVNIVLFFIANNPGM